MKHENLKEIILHIDSSDEVLENAWKNHAPTLSERMRIVGKAVGPRSITKQFEKSNDVVQTNVLRRFKQFLAGSYLTRIKSGETIFANLEDFRSLFFSQPINQIALEQSFFRINDLWFQAQKAFFAKEMDSFAKLLTSLHQEVFYLKRMLAIQQKAALNNSVKRKGLRFLQIFRIFKSK